VLEGVSSTWLGPNLNQIINHVREGTLDFVLLKPFDSQLWLSTRNLAVWGLPGIGCGLLVVGYAGWQLGFGATDAVRGLVPMALGLAILYSIWFLLASTSLWFVKIYNVTFVLRSFLEAGRFPVSAFPTAYRVFFTFLLPVAFLTTVPAEAMLGRCSLSQLTLALVLGLLLFAAARGFWRFSLRFYSSASS